MAEVDAIQPVSPETKSNKFGKTAIDTVAGAAIGTAAYYTMGRKRPSLEEVFAQKADEVKFGEKVADADKQTIKEAINAVANEADNDVKKAKFEAITKNEEFVETFKKVFPKEFKWGKAGLFAGIAAAVGLVTGLVMNKKSAPVDKVDAVA